MAAAADRHRRRAQGHQPFDIRPADRARHADRIGSPAVRGGQRGINSSPQRDGEDDPDINAHQSSPAAALPTNSSLTDGIYFDDLVAKCPSANRSPLGHATVGT